MPEDLRTLIAIQGWVLNCRRLAAETPDDPETARLLLRLADKIEQRAREADTEKLRPQSMGRPTKKPPLG
jgi:hypothetical protein